MRLRRRYTESQKAEACAAFLANDRNLSGTAKKLGVPRKTLEVWIKEMPSLELKDRQILERDSQFQIQQKTGESARRLPGLTVAELRQQKKGDLAAAYEDIAWMCAARLGQSELIEESRNLQALSTVGGIAVDKMRLLRGESTENVAVKVEQHRWAEERLQSMMRDFDLSREEALEIVRDKAPTLAAMLTA